jgi:hypothetical protein
MILPEFRDPPFMGGHQPRVCVVGQGQHGPAPNQGSGGTRGADEALRDQIAIDAMRAEIMARRSIFAPAAETARAAYKLADAMLAARKDRA